MITEQNMKDGYDTLKESIPQMQFELNEAIKNGDWQAAIESIAPLNLAMIGALLIEEFLNPTT